MSDLDATSSQMRTTAHGRAHGPSELRQGTDIVTCRPHLSSAVQLRVGKFGRYTGQAGIFYLTSLTESPDIQCAMLSGNLCLHSPVKSLACTSGRGK